MVARPGASSPAVASGPAAAVPTVYAEGLLAGLVGAVVIAAWFFVLDLLQGRPLYTPTVLGTAFFHGSQALGGGEIPPTSFETVVSFTWVHVLAFLLIGVAASRLLALAERNPSFGFGIVLFFVVFEFGFLGACMLFAEPVLRALAWPAVVVGNLFAAAAMGWVFWRRHPGLAIRP